MKNRLLTLAGALALLGVLGKFYAVPAIAQTVKAALVQDRDQRGRNAYMSHNISCGYAVGICATDLPVVPAGKRLVIESVTGEASMSAPTDLYRVSLWAKNQWAAAFLQFGAPALTANNLYNHTFTHQVFATFDAGQTPQLVLQSNGGGGFAWQAVVSGYMIDIP